MNNIVKAFSPKRPRDPSNENNKQLNYGGNQEDLNNYTVTGTFPQTSEEQRRYSQADMQQSYQPFYPHNMSLQQEQQQQNYHKNLNKPLPSIVSAAATYDTNPRYTGPSTSNEKAPNKDKTEAHPPLAQLPIPMGGKKKQLEKIWANNQAEREEKISYYQNELQTLQDKCRKLEEEAKDLKERKKEAERQSEKANQKAKDLQAQYYDRTKNIKVTDDDFSTIIAKLGKFSGKLSNFPPNSKSSFNKDLALADVTNFFQKVHPKDAEKIYELFYFDTTKVDYALVSVLVEKLIMREITETVFMAPIHLDSKINQAYVELSDYFIKTGHESWVKELRLKTAKATFDMMQDAETKKVNNAAKKVLVDSIVEKLCKIYDKEEDIRSRIEKLVDMAVDLSLPIRGQEDLVEIIHLEKGEAVHKTQVKPLYRLSDSNKIQLGISPVFLAKSTSEEDDAQDLEEDQTQTYKPNHTLVYPGKAIY